MNIREQYEAETGKQCVETRPEDLAKEWTDEYVEWLEAKVQQQIDDRIGCFHCGKRIDKNALYCPHCENAK